MLKRFSFLLAGVCAVAFVAPNSLVRAEDKPAATKDAPKTADKPADKKAETPADKKNGKPADKTADKPKADAAANSTVTPAARDGKQMERHKQINARVKEGATDLLFIGDSITQGWEGAGKDEWAKHFASRNAKNLGIGGDRTQHVLWRLDNGNIEGVKPKAAVIMIGTNNSAADSAENIADGIKAIVEKLRTKLPETKILLLGVFPRGEKSNAQREKLIKVNETVAKLDDGKYVFYLDIGPKFLGADGTISKDIMPDFLHLSPKGYAIWAEAIEPKVKELMGEK